MDSGVGFWVKKKCFFSGIGPGPGVRNFQELAKNRFEILKNAFKASIENDKGTSLISIEDSIGNNDYIIKITDNGNSFDREVLDKIHSFFYTTSGSGTDLSGFGHGLGLSQIYVRYFGGDIKIIPMEGSGTQVIIYFSNFTNNSENVADDFN